jgi:hypothetical protein
LFRDARLAWQRLVQEMTHDQVDTMVVEPPVNHHHVALARVPAVEVDAGPHFA